MTNAALAPPQWALARRSGFYALQYFIMSRIDVSSSDNRKTAAHYARKTPQCASLAKKAQDCDKAVMRMRHPL